MLKTTELFQKKGFDSRVFTDREVDYLFDGTPAKRYGLINKAIKKGELIQLRRGVYILAPKYRSVKLGKFFIACSMVHGSYVSLESALSFHNWIPERVETTSCVIGKNRSQIIDTPLGEFKYIKIPINEYEYFNGVSRNESNGKPFFIASPLRALGDYVYEKKIQWNSIDFLLDGLRMEEENLQLLTMDDFVQVLQVYRSKRVLFFLRQLKLYLEK